MDAIAGIAPKQSTIISSAEIAPCGNATRATEIIATTSGATASSVWGHSCERLWPAAHARHGHARHEHGRHEHARHGLGPGEERRSDGCRNRAARSSRLPSRMQPGAAGAARLAVHRCRANSNSRRARTRRDPRRRAPGAARLRPGRGGGRRRQRSAGRLLAGRPRRGAGSPPDGSRPRDRGRRRQAARPRRAPPPPHARPARMARGERIARGERAGRSSGVSRGRRRRSGA